MNGKQTIHKVIAAVGVLGLLAVSCGDLHPGRRTDQAVMHRVAPRHCRGARSDLGLELFLHAREGPVQDQDDLVDLLVADDERR